MDLQLETCMGSIQATQHEQLNVCTKMPHDFSSGHIRDIVNQYRWGWRLLCTARQTYR